MQTGWIHKDHETQREFERLRNKATATTEQTPATEQPTVQRSATTQLPQREYDLDSPLGTITIDTQKGANKTLWSIDRPLTVSIVDKEIPTRIDGQYALNYRSDTVGHIRLLPGTNIDIQGRYYDKDKIDIEINAATAAVGLEGSLSTVWIKDATQDWGTSFGYNPITGLYVTQIVFGPWGFSATPPSTAPYAGSDYSNNAKDDQWEFGLPLRYDNTSAWTRMGRVNKSGLYWFYGTTQGYRWVSQEVDGYLAPHINLSVHYYAVVKRYSDNPEQPTALQIYKPLDIMRWDEWIGAMTLESRQMFRSAFSSLPWSVNGGCLIWLNANDEVGHMISYYGGNGGETRMNFQICYHAAEAFLVADEGTLDPATQIDLIPVNDPDTAPDYHTMQFYNV